MGGLRSACGVVVLGLIINATALAEDLNPPTWRGYANTSWASWEFSTNANDPAPYDDGFLPWGDPFMSVEPGAGQDWMDISEGRQGVWPLSGWIDVTMQNDPIERPFKEIWLQLTWWPQNETAFPTISITDPPGPIITNPLSEEMLPDGWMYSIYHLQIQPNPSQESLRIQGAIDVDEVVIDTWCVPEPVSLLLIALGGLILSIRRR